MDQYLSSSDLPQWNRQIDLSFPNSPFFSVTATLIPWYCWIFSLQGEDTQCSTGRLNKFSFLFPPYQASAFESECHCNCTSPNLLDYIHSSARKNATQTLRDVPKARWTAPDPMPLFTVTDVNSAGPFYVHSDNGETKASFVSSLVQLRELLI